MSFLYSNIIFLLLPCSDKSKQPTIASLTETPEKWCINLAHKNPEKGAILFSTCWRHLFTQTVLRKS